MNGAVAEVEREALAFTPRSRERRLGLGELLVALARALGQADASLLRGAFEEAVRHVVPVKTVRLRDMAGRWGAKREPVTPESIAFEVPNFGSGGLGVLEATFEPGSRLAEWDFQLLGFACHAATLVLEIERNRVAMMRHGPLAGLRVKSDGAAPLIGSSRVMQQLRSRIERVAGTDFTVLLEGESGVGKELVARQIHDLSRRRTGPFVAINCAALVETLLEAELFGIEERTATGVRGRRGKFENADGGTLFLDEVSDLSLSAQAKLLRAIQDLSVERVGGNGSHRVDIRVVAATNRSLAGLVERQLFRTDLFYRLSGVDIRVPTLRERQPDILELTRYFLERHRQSRRLTLSPAASRALAAYKWPGNVRELERLIEGTVALAESDTVELDDLPQCVRGGCADALIPALANDESMRACGSRYAHLIVERCRGNKREACRILGISYHTLASYLRYQLPEMVAGETEECQDCVAEA